MKVISVRPSKRLREIDEMEILQLNRHFQITLRQSLMAKLGLSVRYYLKADIEDGKMLIRPIQLVPPDQEYFFTKQ